MVYQLAQDQSLDSGVSLTAACDKVSAKLQAKVDNKLAKYMQADVSAKYHTRVQPA